MNLLLKKNSREKTSSSSDSTRFRSSCLVRESFSETAPGTEKDEQKQRVVKQVVAELDKETEQGRKKLLDKSSSGVVRNSSSEPSDSKIAATNAHSTTVSGSYKSAADITSSSLNVHLFQTVTKKALVSHREGNLIENLKKKININESMAKLNRRELKSSSSEMFMVPKENPSGGLKRAVGAEVEKWKNNKSQDLKGQKTVEGGGGSRYTEHNSKKNTEKHGFAGKHTPKVIKG